jgi:Tol biopolymer transport system component
MIRRRALVIGLAALVLAAGAAAALPGVADDLPRPLATAARLPETLWARVFPPRVARATRLDGLTGPERDAVAAIGRRLHGRLVWSSNRSGNHELYLLDLDTQEVRRLTEHPHVDFFSRFSPDGQRILFLRSRKPWVSFRDPTAWDVFVMDAAGGGERRLAEGGYSPQWTPDGRGITFLRGARVVQLDLATGRETVLVDGPSADGIRGGLESPELSPDGRRLALTVRSPAYNGVVVLDLASRRVTRLSESQACQLTWSPREEPIWVDSGGRGGTRIMIEPSGRGRAVLMDLPGRHSHEYFPRVSNDGGWLVWGAAAEGHEHDRADYEIFVWELGTAPEQAVRLTHHPGNDQWPDLWVPSRRG